MVLYKIRIFIGIILTLVLVSCGKEEVASLYENETSETLADYIDNNLSETAVDIINTNAVSITNQSLEVEEYTISLGEFFYDKNVPYVIYEVVIERSDSTKMTSVENESIEQEIQELNLESTLVGLSSATLYEIVTTNEDGNVVWIKSLLLSGISGEDSTRNITDKGKLEQIDFVKDGVEIGSLILPDYSCDENILSLDTVESDEIISASMSDLGMNIIFDISETLEDFKEEMNHLASGENEEAYGYDVLEEIVVVLNDGTQVVIYDSNIGDEYYFNMEVREEQNLASYSILWNSNFEANDIDYILVNGEKVF